MKPKIYPDGRCETCHRHGLKVCLTEGCINCTGAKQVSLPDSAPTRSCHDEGCGKREDEVCWKRNCGRPVARAARDRAASVPRVRRGQPLDHDPEAPWLRDDRTGVLLGVADAGAIAGVRAEHGGCHDPADRVPLRQHRRADGPRGDRAPLARCGV